MATLNGTKWLSLIIGILSIVSGVIGLLNPVITTISVVRFFSFMLIAIGLLKVFRYFSNDLFRIGSFLIAGIIDIVIGVLMLRNVPVSMDVFRVLVGFWILLVGVTEIATAIDLKQVQFQRWWLGLISGLLGLVVGFALITNIEYFVLYISFMFSFYMIVLGLSFISTFVGLRRINKRFK